MVDGFVKLILQVYLIDDAKIRIKVINVHSKIKDYDAVILAEHKRNSFSILKADYCKLTKSWFTIPGNLTKDTKDYCEYTFASDRIRYCALNELRETLMEFSISKAFYQTSQKREEPYIVFNDEFWYIY